MGGREAFFVVLWVFSVYFAYNLAVFLCSLPIFPVQNSFGGYSLLITDASGCPRLYRLDLYSSTHRCELRHCPSAPL